MRVLTMSSGCTINVAMDPAESPANISTSAGVDPPCLDSVIETLRPGRDCYIVTGRRFWMVRRFGYLDVGRGILDMENDDRVPTALKKKKKKKKKSTRLRAQTTESPSAC